MKDRVGTATFDFISQPLDEGGCYTFFVPKLTVLKGDEINLRWGLLQVAATIEDLEPVTETVIQVKARPHGPTEALGPWD